MRHPFLVRLDRGPLLADGAIGTLLHERGVPWRRSIDAVTLTDRTLLSQMHLDYLLAGAELLTTNTFGSNRVRLAEHGLADRVRDLNLHAVKVAREAREVAGRPAFVAGAVGSIVRGDAERSAALETEAERGAAYREQVAALLEGGADAIHLETFTDLDDIAVAIAAVREASDLPVIASVSFDHELRAAGDATPEHVAERLLALEVDVVGINCSVGPHHALETLERMRAAGAEHTCVMPNAGLPSRQGATFLYRSTPDYFAEYARRFVDAGATIVGGCCGTTPRHTAAMALALEDVTPLRDRPAPSVRAGATEPAPPRSADEPSQLAQALDRGDFVVSVELAPPKGVSAEKVLEGARMLEAHDLRFVNVTDSAMARVRMGAIAVARLVQEHTSLEAVIHFTTRDRNLMALQSDLLGAHALGVRNVLALTGDPPSIGDYPDAAGVWDLESPGLVEALHRMNEGTDLRGRDIGGAASFCIGAAVNPTAEDLPLELERLAAKVGAGAHFVMSQPLYDMATLERFLERVDIGRRGDSGIPFLLGILPLQSSRHAEYMHHEVPGIEVPAELRAAMRDAGAEGTATGIALAQEFIAEARSLVDGVYLMPSFGRYELCAHLLDAIGAHA